MIFYAYHLHDPEKFMGCVMASYRSILNATNTYVEAYVTLTCMNRMNLHARFPARQETVTRQMMSVSTFRRPTHKSKEIMYPFWLSK